MINIIMNPTRRKRSRDEKKEYDVGYHIIFKTYILIQYIWYQNICLKSYNASSKFCSMAISFQSLKNWSFQ